MTTSAAEARRCLAVAQCLAEQPIERVVQLRGLSADDLALASANGSADLPAVLVCDFVPTVTLAQFVETFLDELEAVAIAIFPAWLPGAENVHVCSGAGAAAVRALAAAQASRSRQDGPLLSDLAATALGAGRSRGRQFLAERRARSLPRVIADGFGRDRIAIAARLPARMRAVDEEIVAAGSEWLADHGRLGVWLTGEPMVTVDRFPTVAPVHTAAPATLVPPARRSVLGAPHPRSDAEAMLEAMLAKQAWAQGRRWNQTYQSHTLRDPIRLDLLWPEERCVVEVDGPDHRQLAKFEADRRRDVQLQLDGYAVLRFTNARILYDVEAVANQIRQFIEARRGANLKGTP